MAHPHADARAHHHERAHSIMSRTGYASGGSVHEDEKEDAGMVRSGVRQHEQAMHRGEKETKLKLASGGHVDGAGAHHHLGRRARGGHAGKRSTHVNVIVAPQGGGAGMQHPMMPTAQPAAMPPPRPPAPSPAPAPMGAAPPRPGMGGPPGGAMGMPRQPGMKRGGGVQKVEEVGAGKHDAFLQAARGGKIKRDMGGPMGNPQGQMTPQQIQQIAQMRAMQRAQQGSQAQGAAPMAGAQMTPPMGAAQAQRMAAMPQQKDGGKVKVKEHTRRARGGNIPHEEAGAGSGIGRIDKVHEYGEGRGFKPKKVPLHA